MMIVVAAYWSDRPESKDAAAVRMAGFLSTISHHSDELAHWFKQGKTESKQRLIPNDESHIARLLAPNRRDSDKRPIDKLGFRMGMWNGRDVSLDARLGAYNSRSPNSVVMEFELAGQPREYFRLILEDMVRVFDPDEALVWSPGDSGSAAPGISWSHAWFTYRRGEAIRDAST